MNKLKRILALTAVTAVCGCSAAFAACANSEHEHAWNNGEITTPATCTDDGVKTFTCTVDGCGETRTEAVDAGHDWGAWQKTADATCTEAGEEARVCSRDGSHKETRTAGAAKGHSWDGGEVTTPATCTEEGEKTFTCTAEGCGETRTGPVDADPAAHDWGAWSQNTPATCTEAKTEQRVCNNNNGHKETRSVGEPDGHDWNDGEVTTQPQLDAEGEKTYTCNTDGCGATKKEPVPALNHVHTYTGEWKKDGSAHWKECDGAGCNETTEKTAHGWNGGSVTTPATCSAEGVKTYGCETCGAEKTEAVPVDADAHEWGGWTEKTPATCAAAKVEERVCEHNDEHTDTQSVGEALDHDFGEWSLTTAPTAAEEGAAEQTCERDGCSATNTAALPKLGDEAYTLGEDSATCTEAGKMQHGVTLEGKYFSFEVDTAAKGHTLLEIEAKAATCMDTGNEAYYVCTDCYGLFSDENAEYGISEPVVTPVAAHSMTSVGKKEPTCVEEGVQQHWVCDWCNVTFADPDGEAVLIDTSLPAYGHVFSEEFTHDTENKKYIWKCEACGEDGKVKGYDESVTNGLTGAQTNTTYNICGTSTSATTVNLGIQNVQMTETGKYVFEFEYLDNESYPVKNTRTTIRIGASNKMFITGNETDGYSFNTASGLANNVSVVFDGLNRLTKVIVNVDGATVTTDSLIAVSISAPVTAAGESRQFLFRYNLGESVKYGENKVSVTQANATTASSKDSYTFTSEETKTYSVSVPAGLTVVADGKELVKAGSEPAFANFKAEAGKTVTFTFISSQTGEYNVVIGEKINRYMNLNETKDAAVTDSPEAFTVAEGLEEKEYTLVVTMHMNIRLYMYVIVNDENVSVVNGNLKKSDADGAMYIYLAKGTTSASDDGWSYTCPSRGSEFTIKLRLKAGDTVSFMTIGTSGSCTYTLSE